MDFVDMPSLDPSEELVRITGLLQHMLNHPTEKDREFVLAFIKTSTEISEPMKRILLKGIDELGPQAPKDDNYRYNYSLNENLEYNGSMYYKNDIYMFFDLSKCIKSYYL